MHQSIPIAPCPPPPGNCGAFARLVSPGGGALANLARPGGRAFANPGDNPENFVDVFKGIFFLILTCTLIEKAIISKQIVRACVNCHVSQQSAFDSLRIAGHFAVYFRPYRRAFDSLSARTPGNLQSIRKKRQFPGGQPGGGGRAHLELTDA